MKIDLQDSPWTLVLLVSLVCLVGLTIALVLVPKASTAALAGMGVWAGLVGTALAVGVSRAKNDGGGDDE